MAQVYTALGMMSGTSYDGVDLGIITVDASGVASSTLGAAKTYPYSNQLKLQIAQLCSGNYQNIWQTERDISDFHLEVAKDFLASQKVDLIGFHGQTIYHNISQKITVQLGNPHTLAQGLATDVIYDFRRRDVASGGSGAPLVPIFLRAVKPKSLDSACFLNLGGVANICYINTVKDQLIAFDAGPCNGPMNDLCLKAFNKDFDDTGTIAASGKVDNALLEKWAHNNFFTQAYPKALDRNHFDFTTDYLIPPADLLATMVEFTAYSIKKAVELLPSGSGGPNLNQIIASGGGVHNKYLLARIGALTGVNVVTSEHYHLPADYLEAYAFGYLAILSKLGLPISFPNTTGVARPTSGGVLIRAKP